MKIFKLKQYHIADILTLCEVICTCILGVLLFIGAKPQTALIVFGIGELCDAFDGICARNLKPYPKAANTAGGENTPQKSTRLPTFFT